MGLRTKGRLTVNTVKGRAGVSDEIHNKNVLDNLLHGYNDINDEDILIDQYHVGYFGRLARTKKDKK